jgi:DedD protein
VLSAFAGQALVSAAPFDAAPALAAAPEAAGSEAGVSRYVVQVGAFNDNTRMREARMKVERIGYKTYTSEVDSPSGRRTRVRLGPFPTKAEAEAAAVKVKTTGLPANVLKL